MHRLWSRFARKKLMLTRFSSVHFNGDKKKKIEKMSPDAPSHSAVSNEAKQWKWLVSVKPWWSASRTAVWTAKGGDGRHGPRWAASEGEERLPPD